MVKFGDGLHFESGRAQSSVEWFHVAYKFDGTVNLPGLYVLIVTSENVRVFTIFLHVCGMCTQW